MLGKCLRQAKHNFKNNNLKNNFCAGLFFIYCYRLFRFCHKSEPELTTLRLPVSSKSLISKDALLITL